MRAVAVAVAMMVATIARAADPVVILVVIDGLGADMATPARLPRLAARAAAPRSTWTTARGVLPARTNPNHASILTGYWPDGHGIVGNRYWDAATRARVATDQPRLLEAATIFDVLATEHPTAVRAAFFGKAKLRRLFGARPDATGPAMTIWDPGGEYDSDDTTLQAARGAVRRDMPEALVVVGIADVDRTSHRTGPGTTEVEAAIARADLLLDGFFGVLVERGLWDRAVVIVTADHGFARVDEGGIIELPAGTRDGFAWVDEGRVALGHAMGREGSETPPAAILRRRGVAGVRDDLSAIGLGHPRAGTLMLMAAPGFAFTLNRAAYRMRGDHGGDAERVVPFVVVGGHPSLQPLPAGVHPELPDVAPTLASVFGVQDPQTRRAGVGGRGRRLALWNGPPERRETGGARAP